MRFRPAFVAALLTVALAGALAAPGVAGSSTADAWGPGATDGVSAPSGVQATESASDATAGASGSPSVPFDRADPGLVVTIQLRENGDARFHVTHRFEVNGSNETAAFESFASSVVEGDRTIGTEVQTFSRFAASASEATGRNMSIEDAGWRSSSLENGTGELTYSFTWTDFGQTEADRMVIGDAFRSPDGTWLPRLYDGQRLVIRPPPSLTIVGTPPDKGVTERTLVWNGYREFAPGYLEVVLEQPTQPTTTETVVPPTTTTPPQGSWELSPFLLGVGFALLLVLVGAGSYLFARWQTERDDDDDGAPGATGSGTDDPPAGASEASASGDASGETASDVAGSSGGGSARESGAASGDASPGDDAGSAANAGAGSSGAAAGAGAAASADSATATDEDEVDETLLSDEERVLRLLEENGGRMKQANIVSETGWSNAKVSQLLSGMAEDEDVQKLRIGRENLITLPDENVADFGTDDQ